MDLSASQHSAKRKAAQLPEAAGAIQQALTNLEDQRGNLNSIKEVLELTEAQLISITASLTGGASSPDWKSVRDILNNAKAVVYFAEGDETAKTSVKDPTATRKQKPRKPTRSDYDFFTKKRINYTPISGKKVKIAAKRQKHVEAEEDPLTLDGQVLSLAPPTGSPSHRP